MTDTATVIRTNAWALPERRGLSRVQAAGYIGISARKFDEMVGDGRMPGPRRIDGRRLWDRRELDEAFEALPREGEDGGPEKNEWDDAV